MKNIKIVNKSGVVYMITSPNGRLYVGSTVNIKDRIRFYKGMHHTNQTKLYNSMAKYGFKSHLIEIVWEGDIKEMYNAETLIGLGFDVLNPFNMNCKLPKFGDVYKVVSDETRAKMSAWQIGRKMSNEAKEKMRQAKLGKPASENTKKRAREFHSKPVIQYDRNWNFIKRWNSMTEAGKELQISSCSIGGCCMKKPKMKTCGGFKWEYVDK